MLNTDQFGDEEDDDEPGPFYHGTRSSLGPSVDPGGQRNHGMTRSGYAYFSADPEMAMRYARAAKGPGEPKVYRVTPAGSYGKDPGSYKGYRSKDPLKVHGPVDDLRKAPRNTYHNGQYVEHDEDYQQDATHFDRMWRG